jgi:UV DNA damage endonuclease
MIRSVQNFGPSLAYRTAQRATLVLHSFRTFPYLAAMPPKRKASTAAASPAAGEAPADRSKMRRSEVPLPPKPAAKGKQLPRRQSSRGGAAVTNPDVNPEVLDAPNALRASPDGHECADEEVHLHQHDVDAGDAVNGVNADPAKPSTSQNATTEVKTVPTNGAGSIDEAGAISAAPAAGRVKRKKAGAAHVKTEGGDSNIAPTNGVLGSAAPAEDAGVTGDPEAEGLDGEEGDEVELKEALARPPPVNSEYLPLPWKGRLGYVRPCMPPCNLTKLTCTSGLSQHLPSKRQSSRVQL